MPPSKTFSREGIIDAAFALVRAKGLAALSMRNVAARSPFYFFNAQSIVCR